MSERKFPGLLIQGDSLKILAGVLDEANQAMADGEVEDAVSALRESRDQVVSWVMEYEEMMKENHLGLPYHE